jgi:hypothetical protein
MLPSGDLSNGSKGISRKLDPLHALAKAVHQEDINEHLETFWTGVRFIAWSESSTKAQDIDELWEEMVAGLQGVFGTCTLELTSEMIKVGQIFRLHF